MNLCRSCKYWAVRAHAIGMGCCCNRDVQLRLFREENILTAQDFGCVLHEEGPQWAAIYSDEEIERIRKEFLEWKERL
jgi:hypothetical protein